MGKRVCFVKVVVFGAAGRTGRLIVEQAQAAGHTVTAFARNPARLMLAYPGVRVVRGDALQPDLVAGAVEGQDAVITALGTEGRGESSILTESMGNILRAMKAYGVRRIVMVSSAGIHGEVPGLFGKLTTYFLRKALADHRGAVEQLKASGLDWVALRPMRLMDTPATGRYRVAEVGIPPGGRTISRADVAEFALRQLGVDTYLGKSPAITD